MVSLKAVIGIGCGAGVLLLAWLGQSSTGPVSATAPSTSGIVSAMPAASSPAPRATSASATAAISGGGSVALDEPSVPAPEPSPSTTSIPEVEASQYTAAARTFMQTFARPPAAVPAEQWWQKVKPLLSAQAAQDYQGTDPANVPFTRITADPELVPAAGSAQGSGLTVARVETDTGTYLVVMTKENGTILVVSATPQSAGAS